MNRPAPVEITYECMRFLITHNPTNSQLVKFTEVRIKMGAVHMNSNINNRVKADYFFLYWCLLGTEEFWSADACPGLWCNLWENTSGKRRHWSFGEINLFKYPKDSDRISFFDIIAEDCFFVLFNAKMCFPLGLAFWWWLFAPWTNCWWLVEPSQM